MRVAAIAMFAVFLLADAFAQPADESVCGSIRLSAAEQLQCRYRLKNALGPGDARRTRDEYEAKVRAATNNLVTPPVVVAPVPPPRDAELKPQHHLEPRPSDPGASRSPQKHEPAASTVQE
ncbi:MAG: hypothetical protein RLN70_03055 [Rhodospirillaceae bacterium]